MNERPAHRKYLGGDARQRARGEVRAEFSTAGSRTYLRTVYQTGGMRLGMPKSGAAAEAVLINTGGGMAGGDRTLLDFLIAPGAHASVTTQSAEKIYRSDGEAALIRCRLRVGSSGRFEWLPQETILFEGAVLTRNMRVDVGEDAGLLMMEATTFGRTAFGEDRINAVVRDSWRVYRGGRLAFAEEIRFDAAGHALQRRAVAERARAMFSVLLVAKDPQTALSVLRGAFSDCTDESEPLEWGASIVAGVVVGRAVSSSPTELRSGFNRVASILRARPVPRSWQ